MFPLRRPTPSGLSALFAISLVCICQVRGAPFVVAPVEATKGMAVCVSPDAADVGIAVLRAGGNAVDASVAVALALAVTYPPAGNIGGGGFMLVCPPDRDAKPTMIDFRETAPASVREDSLGKETSMRTHKAVGIPGTLRGLELAHKKYGKLPWKDLVEPAIRLAREGFVLDARLASSLNSALAEKGVNREFVRTFSNPVGAAWKGGDRLIQKDLARVLTAIGQRGANGFYEGEVARAIEQDMIENGGYLTAKDLAGYKAVERVPIHGTYRGHDIYAASPPSSGGICLVQMLNVLERFDVKAHPRDSPETVHLLAEVMRRAFADRAKYLGDPDFVAIPSHLTTKEYAAKLAEGISPDRATKSEALATEIPLAKESEETTHFSIVDERGMAVSCTYTLEDSFGSRVVVPGTGFILNNEMGDFNTRPGVTDRGGRIGTKPNRIAPGKRMLSSQTPTIVRKDGKTLLITGSPGSRTIINTVLGIVVSTVDYDMDIASAVASPRMHMQWFPDTIVLEDRSASLTKALEAMGHDVKYRGSQGDAHSIRIDAKTGKYTGAADSRLNGKAAGY